MVISLADVALVELVELVFAGAACAFAAGTKPATEIEIVAAARMAATNGIPRHLLRRADSLGEPLFGSSSRLAIGDRRFTLMQNPLGGSDHGFFVKKTLKNIVGQ